MDNSSIKYYPDLDDINFNKKIIEKREFNQYIMDSYVDKNIEELCLFDNFISRPIQRMLQLYLSPNTPYNGLLLFHTTGSGKTSTSILIAEQFIDYVQSNDSYVYLVASPILVENFNDTIFNTNENLNRTNKNNTKQKTGYIYSKIYEQYLKETNNNISKANNLIKEYKNMRYKGYGYISLVNSITKSNNEYIEPDIIKSRFSNSVIIIDEAHTYNRDTPTYDGLKYILTHADNVKLMLLSATPMSDKSIQILDLLNLLLINDNKEEIPYNDIFEISQGDNRKIINKELFIKITTGYVSYLNGINPITFPLKLYPDDSIYIRLNEERNNIIVSQGNTGYNIFPCEMSSFQYNISKKLSSNINISNDNNLIYGIQANLISYPNDKIGDEGFNICFKYNKELDMYKYQCFENFLQPQNIKKYSIKLYKLAQELSNKNLSGKIFISTKFIKSGAHLVGMLLEEIGYNRIKYSNGKFITKNLLKQNPPSSPNYIMITGELKSSSLIKKYINEYNHIDNINGNNIQIIIGSDVIQQGTSLFGIREIHILEPWWNYSHIEQIIGRGIRDCSHINLPPQKRNITIYNYISTYKDNYTSDINQLTKTLDKNINIKEITRLLKRNSIDCYISKNININKDYPDIEIITSKNNKKIVSQNDMDYSLECDYDTCDYKCIGVEDDSFKNNIDNDTYDIFNDTISNINISKLYIKKLFELKLFYTLEQITKAIIQQDKYINEKSINIALTEIINNKDVVYDKFNRDGYIIHKDQYYIYQPNEISDEFIPMYLRKYPLKYRLHSIKNLVKYKNDTKLDLSISTDTNSYNYYDKLIINKLLSNKQIYDKVFNNVNKNDIAKMTLFDILYAFINKLNDTDYIIDILLSSHSSNRYSIHFVNNFSNKSLNQKFSVYKKFYELELVSIEYKAIVLQYIIIKSILNKNMSQLDNFIINYNKDILINYDNKYIGFILYKHNPNYINEYKNGDDPFTEIPFIYIYYKNIWYLNLSINDISYININIKNIINNLTSKYNVEIADTKKQIINDKHIVGLIGKLPNEDISVFKIVKFVEQQIIKKKEKLTNITISTIKDLQIKSILDLLKYIIKLIKQLINKYNLIYNIFDIENELNSFISKDTTKKKHIISLIIFLLTDLHINKFADRNWLISSHKSAILKRNSLLNISRTEKQNISLSVHKGLPVV